MIHRQPPRAAALLGVLVVSALVSGCGPSQIQPKAEPGTTPALNTPSAAPSSSPSGPPPAVPVAVLTGLASTATGPAVVVPVLVGSGTTAPTGLADADIASVEFAEGASLRIVGIYQSRHASSVGPVTMVRPSDAKVFGQAKPVFVEIGSPPGFLDVLRAANLAYMTADAGHSGFAKHGAAVFADTGVVSRGAPRYSVPPTAMFQYAAPSQPVSGADVSPATKIVISVPGHPAITWLWDSAAHLWQTTIGGAKVSATNVVALGSVPYTKKLVSALKSNVAFADPFGSGAAQIAAGDQTIKATWFKKGFAAGLNLLGPDKTVPMLLPGRTWMLLVPTGSSVIIS